MAAIKASVNVFTLLDGDDPGDKRLADLDAPRKDEPKKKPVSAAACDYKLKLMKKQPAPAAVSKSKALKKIPTPVAASGLRSSTAKAVNKRSTMPAAPAPPPARSTNYTALLFGKAYPSARERIFKQRREEFERRQAEAVADGDGKSAAEHAGAGPAAHGSEQKEAHAPVPAPAAAAAPAPAPAPAPAVLKTSSLPPPRLEDTDHFPSLK